jgi:hypothetical protein
MGIAVDVKLELHAMEQLQIKVPRSAFIFVDNNHEKIVEMQQAGMTPNEIADFIVKEVKVANLFKPES